MDTIFEIQRIKQEVTETNKYQITHITSPIDAARLGTEIIGDEDREVLLVIVLNTKSKVVAIHRCHIGALSSTVIHPREIFKSAILNNGASLIVIHNHPSYNPSPSPQDIDFTKRISKAGELLGIELLDSIIVTNEAINYYSMNENGYL